MPRAFLTVVFVACVALSCDDRPPLPDTQSLDDSFERGAATTLDAARIHFTESQNRARDMKKRLEPDEGRDAGSASDAE